MYRDPSEFRERFKAYKEGKSVREIYGLPGYVGGKSSSAIDDTADFLRLYEGFNEKTYLDGKGIPTIGYGFTDAKFVNKGKITRAEAEVELKRLIAVRQAELRRKLGPQVWDSLSNDSKKALTSYHFNYPAGFKDNTKFMLYWKAGRYSDAIKEVDAGWNDPNNPGLRTRRIAELKLLRNDPVLFQRPVSEKPSDAIILRPDELRVAPIPTIQLKAIDYSDRRNAVAAETLRAIWARNVMDSLQEGYKVPMWEPQPLPALLPVEMDVVPFKTYSNGKLPGYLGGKEAMIQQGRKQLPIDKAEAATEPDYNEGWLLTTLKRGANNFIKTVKDQVRSARNIVNGRGDWFDWLNVGTDVVLGAGGKAVKGAAKEAKAAVKAIKPKKSSVKFNTKDPNKVGAYYTAHPEEVTPITNSEELNDVVNFINTHIAPKYARQNKVHIGIDPADIKLGSADLSGTNLGGYVGPSGEVVINQDILNNSDVLRRVLGHEVAGHWLDLHYPLTPAQASIVLNGVRFNADFLNSRPWFDLFAEGNAERRLFNYLSSRDNGNVVGSELDAIINSMPRAQAKRYADMLGYNKGIEWQWPDILPFKQAATSVPTIGIPLYAGTLIDRLYKNGKLPGYEDGEISMGAKRNLTEELLNTALLNILHEQGMSGEDPVLSTLIGMKALRLVGDLLSSRRLRQKAELYKRIREANDQTRNASRAWKILDADKYARDWGMSNNPAGFLYDIFLDPLANLYTKILKHPVLGPLIPFKNGKLPGYSNGKIRIKPANRGKFNATKKRTGKTTEELTHSKNPLTRKRAIFALNARKWNHK